jgi:hypothetical protein
LDSKNLEIEEAQFCEQLNDHYQLPKEGEWSMMPFKKRFPKSKLNKKEPSVQVGRVNMDATTKVYNFFAVDDRQGGYDVFAEWGRINGKTFKTKSCGSRKDLEGVQELIHDLVKSRINKGYQLTK